MEHRKDLIMLTEIMRCGFGEGIIPQEVRNHVLENQIARLKDLIHVLKWRKFRNFRLPCCMHSPVLQ